MTDHDRLDELASAHLDGATSPEEAAFIAADPALQARVEELRAVRDAVGALPRVDPARRDAALAAALAAFEDDGRETTGPIAPVRSLTAVAARRGPSPRARRLVGAAAAVVLLVALAPLIGKLGGSDDDRADQATGFEETGGAIGGEASDGGGSAPEADTDGDVPSTTTAEHLLDLGAYESFAALEAAVGADGAADFGGGLEAAPSFGGDDTDAACAPGVARQASSEGATAITTAIATVGGTPVVVLITTDASGGRTVRVYGADACTLLSERSL